MTLAALISAALRALFPAPVQAAPKAYPEDKPKPAPAAQPAPGAGPDDDEKPSSGLEAARRRAREVAAGGFREMYVSYSGDGEYTSSVDVEA